MCKSRLSFLGVVIFSSCVLERGRRAVARVMCIRAWREVFLDTVEQTLVKKAMRCG